jgi:peptidoglycan hydrolase-like protein with peptidoglycan-binding domain
LPYPAIRRTGTAVSAALIGVCAVAAAPASARVYHLGDRVLKQGMSGRDVRVLQDYLTRTGLDTPVAGYFGPVTKTNVRRFERRYHLRADGVVSRAVARDLRIAVAFLAAPNAQNTSTTDAIHPTATSANTGASGGATVDAVPAGAGSDTAATGKGTLNGDGTASPPAGAPAVIQRIFAAANKIASMPYVYGGGHQSWNDSGYDCSGSLSYALHGGGLISSPEDSSELESYGSPGPGRWITIYANSGHTYMVIAGLRFDTAAQGDTGGSRWTDQMRSGSGYVVVHPTGW